MGLAGRPPPLPVVAADAVRARSESAPDSGVMPAVAPPERPKGPEESPDPKAAAMREVFDRGVKHFTAGRLEEALLEFRQANEMRPQPALVVTVATCLERLGRRGEAYAEYRRYLGASGAALGPSRRDAVEMALARLRPLVAFLEIAPPGPGVGVLLDGRHVDAGSEPIPVDPGAHVVEPELLEGSRARERIIVGAGETRRVTLRFPPRADKSQEDAAPPEHLSLVSPAEVRDDRERIVDMMLATPLVDWVPKRGRWIGPVAAALAFGIGALAGATWGLQRALETTTRAPVAHSAPSPPQKAAAAMPRRAPPAPAPSRQERPSGPEPATVPALPAVPEPRHSSRTAPPERPAPAASAMVELEVTSEPAGAMVRAGGMALGRTPITIFLPGTRSSAVRLELEGHDPRTVRWSPNSGRGAIHVVLQPRAGDESEPARVP